MSPNEFADLVPVIKTLNKESDSINSTLSDLNKALASLNIGIEVWVGRWFELKGREALQFGYARVGDSKEQAWELAVRHCEIDQDEDEFWNIVPSSTTSPAESLLRCARNVRIEALEIVPVILQELKETAERHIRTIEKAKKLVADLGTTPKSLPRITKSLPSIDSVTE